MLSPSRRQVVYALLTRSPLGVIANSPFDLHVLGTPPAFVLSQDQTLHKIYYEEPWWLLIKLTTFFVALLVKEALNIWLFLPTLFSFQGTLGSRLALRLLPVSSLGSNFYMLTHPLGLRQHTVFGIRYDRSDQSASSYSPRPFPAKYLQRIRA